MDILTFGQVILFQNNYYVWLVPDEEEGEIHLAKILDMDGTRDLKLIDERNAKRSSTSHDAPIYAYVVLTTDDFDGRAACLVGSNSHVDASDGFSILKSLNDEDIKELKQCILAGNGLPPRLVNLVKKLG